MALSTYSYLERWIEAAVEVSRIHVPGQEALWFYMIVDEETFGWISVNVCGYRNVVCRSLCWDKQNDYSTIVISRKSTQTDIVYIIYLFD